MAFTAHLKAQYIVSISNGIMYVCVSLYVNLNIYKYLLKISPINFCHLLWYSSISLL